ncbi:MAG: RNA polymerase sigma factor, partial [Planctomycetes bacterium]|nr:RNA polymerase sigma factor [Planctomycetota bacterium]
YKPTSKFTSWLFTIVNNVCLNQIRDRKRRQTQSLFTDSSPQVNLPGDQKTASSQLRGWELKVTVRSALDALPDSQKMAVILNKFEGFSYEEIARVMNVSVAAVKSILFRARENLKKKLKSYM